VPASEGSRSGGSSPSGPAWHARSRGLARYRGQARTSHQRLLRGHADGGWDEEDDRGDRRRTRRHTKDRRPSLGSFPGTAGRCPAAVVAISVESNADAGHQLHANGGLIDGLVCVVIGEVLARIDILVIRAVGGVVTLQRATEIVFSATSQ
jgi:hypothetical protein